MRKRNREMLLWLSGKEFRKLEKDRKAAGQTRQEYILELVHRLPPVSCPKPDLKRVREMFDNDGRLINDIARMINTTGHIDLDRYVSAVNDLHIHMTQFEEEIQNEIRRLEDEEEIPQKA